MKYKDTQIGVPETIYKNTKTAIEALSAVEGMIAYAIDTDQFGSFNGATWDWVSAATGNVATDNIWNAKGDLAVATGTHSAAALPVGADGQVLTAYSTGTFGMRWSTIAGTGDVLGPATSADNTIARFDGTNNKTIQGSLAVVNDDGSINIPTGTYNIQGVPHTHAGGSVPPALNVYLATTFT